jgi:uncharacterized protein (DUF779 family)
MQGGVPDPGCLSSQGWGHAHRLCNTTHSRRHGTCLAHLTGDSNMVVEKVVATPAAQALIALLKDKHGPGLMFHQSGGCCDNSAANCYLLGELTIGQGDVYLGDIGGCPFYMSTSQYAYWKHTQLIIDVIDTHGGGTFSLEGPEGKAFHTRSRVFSSDELEALQQQDAPAIANNAQS